MFDTFSLTVVLGTFLLAGAVKGVIGLGLPTVSLAILTAAVGLPQAMALLLVPSLVTNIWQALIGGNGKTMIRRLWPFLGTATVTVWIGASALTRIDLYWLIALLGLLLIIYSTISLLGFRLAINPSQEAWLGPLTGVANGIFTGMTGSFVVPGVMYLQGIGLSRDALVQAMGMLFTVSTFALALALWGNGLLTNQLGFLSFIALLPAIAGMQLGRRIRQRLPEKKFRRMFFIALFLLGFYIIINSPQ